MISNVKTTLLFRRRIVYSEQSFAEIVLWHLPAPLAGSPHSFKYRLAYVVQGECVIRYDNEAGKGDHLHVAGTEVAYEFVSPEGLVRDFQSRVERWTDENRDA